MKNQINESITTRNFEESDVDMVRKFVSLCKPLDLHSPFTYWILAKYFRDYCFILLEEDKIIGFISSIKSASDYNNLYLWQIGIAESKRGQGYAAMLIDKVVEQARKSDCKKIQFSIAPENEPSHNAFNSYADINGLTMDRIDKLEINDTLSGIIEFEDIYEINL